MADHKVGTREEWLAAREGIRPMVEAGIPTIVDQLASASGTYVVG